MSPAKGRYLVATREFAPGDTIYKETAFACVSHDPSVCIACGKREQDEIVIPQQTIGIMRCSNTRSTCIHRTDHSIFFCVSRATGKMRANPQTEVLAAKHSLGAHRASCKQYQVW